MYKDSTNIPVDFVKVDIYNKTIHGLKEMYADIILPSNELYLRRRIALAASGLNESVENIVTQIAEKNTTFTDKFISFLYSDHTEFFRDSEVWVRFYNILKNGSKAELPKKIYLPWTTKGEELYSLMILLHELEIYEDFIVEINGPSHWALEKILNGEMAQLKMRSSIMNIMNVFKNIDTSRYITTKNSFTNFKKEYLKNVNISSASDNFDFIFARNKSLNFSIKDSFKIHSDIIEKLKKKGLIFFGADEIIDSKLMDRIIVYSAADNIYQKVY